MDVRCERCLTEYELEDSAVSDAGTEVQCTSCGHTFVIARPTALPPAEALPGTTEGPPPPADWLLETPDGQVHRFRNLTSLQKWIIERKVTRDDRISKVGHGWRTLGDIVELAPFFDVVDEADHARATKVGAEDLVAEAAAARQVARRTPAEGAPADLVPASGGPKRALTPLVTRKLAGNSDATLLPPALSPSPLSSTEVVRLPRRNHRAGKLVAGCAVLGVFGYVGLRLWQTNQELRGVGTATSHAAPAVPTPSEPPPPAQEPLPNAEPNPAAAPAAPAPPSPEPAAVAPAPEHAPSSPEPAAAVPAPSAPAEPAPMPAPPPAAKAEDPRAAYAAIIAEADRALENGARGKATKLYDRALALKPGGPEATTGLAYLMLDRGKTDKAIALFRKAIASAPHPPAVFGLAEAQRAAGAREDALANYERYLELAPRGEDAPAARRQVKALREPPAPQNEPPAPRTDEPPPTPSSVLNEAAKP